MKISKIKNQSLSSLVCDYQICNTCFTVDRNRERQRTGFLCPVCNTESTGGHLYFHLNIHILTNLIQDAYHSPSRNKSLISGTIGREAHVASVIIFFSTLREALLENLVVYLCTINNIPKRVFERLMSDNKFHVQKQNNLFPSLTGTKWKEAIKELSQESEIDYEALDLFVKDVADSRNDFVHKGNIFSMNEEMAADCLEKTGPLISLYAELHNKYVHPLKMRALLPK